MNKTISSNTYLGIQNIKEFHRQMFVYGEAYTLFLLPPTKRKRGYQKLVGENFILTPNVPKKGRALRLWPEISVIGRSVRMRNKPNRNWLRIDVPGPIPFYLSGYTVKKYYMPKPRP